MRCGHGAAPTSRRSAWFLADDKNGLALVNIARDSFATELSGYGSEFARIKERASGFGSRQQGTAAWVTVDVIARLTRRLTAVVWVSGDVADAAADGPALGQARSPPAAE